jgi:hypothetical protein
MRTKLSHSERLFFWYVDLKKKRVGYPSVIHFEGCLVSGPEEICDLFAELVQRTYTVDVWVPSDPGPEHVLDDPPFGALQFSADEVESVLQDLDVDKSSGPVHLLLQNHYLFFLTDHTLLRYSRKVGVTTLKTIVAKQYYMQFQSVLN